MAIFGALKRKPMFGQIPGMMGGPYDTPPISGGFPQDMEVGAMQPNMQAMTKKPGFFGQGQPGRHIAGFIGDALQQIGGGEPTYMPNLMEMRQQDAMIRARLAEAQQKQKQDREKFLFEEQYKRANLMPVNNDTVNDLNWYKGLSEEDRKLYHQMKPVTGLRADGTPYAYNPYDVGTRSNLDAQPTSEDGYDYIPGPGGRANPANWKQSGGGVRNGTSGF